MKCQPYSHNIKSIGFAYEFIAFEPHIDVNNSDATTEQKNIIHKHTCYVTFARFNHTFTVDIINGETRISNKK